MPPKMKKFWKICFQRYVNETFRAFPCIYWEVYPLYSFSLSHSCGGWQREVSAKLKKKLTYFYIMFIPYK